MQDVYLSHNIINYFQIILNGIKKNSLENLISKTKQRLLVHHENILSFFLWIMNFSHMINWFFLCLLRYNLPCLVPLFSTHISHQLYWIGDLVILSVESSILHKKLSFPNKNMCLTLLSTFLRNWIRKGCWCWFDCLGFKFWSIGLHYGALKLCVVEDRIL